MTSEEIMLRKAEINERVTAEDADISIEELVQLEHEARSLNEELEELRSKADKKAEIRKLAEVNGTTIKDFKKEEEKKMEERTFAIDSVEYRDAYMKSLQGKPMSIEERGALTSAASVIPTTTLNKIYGLLNENQVISQIDALHIPGYVSIPKATAFADANWVAMGTAATEGTDTVSAVSLSAYKLIKTVEITADIKAMAIPAFEEWLVKKLADKMEAAIEAAIINGSGSSQPTGIGQANITLSTAIATPTIAKLLAFMSGLKTAYHKNAVWIMSAENFYSKVANLANDSNGIVLMNGVQPMLLGHPVLFSDAVDSCKFKSGGSQEASNADHVIFGSLKDGYVFNYGEGINIESDQSVAFRSGSTVYRAMALCDGKCVDTDAFVCAVIS